MTGSANHQQLAALLDPGARQIQMSDSPSPSSHPVTGSIIHSGQGVPIRDSFACFFSIGGGRLTPNKGKAHTQQINTKQPPIPEYLQPKITMPGVQKEVGLHHPKMSLAA
ncbi:hypothetical protein PVAP13_3KG120600 [Panicum virgatum]|uniref:Uncharacterized protein n=1 Tax=Panicum virgatum TaxID=38727 RepID=A0A8T0UQF7_PANVG|nr:hypothetical protein PVAP13_3KG120600 [Panicum virgatum]